MMEQRDELFANLAHVRVMKLPAVLHGRELDLKDGEKKRNVTKSSNKTKKKQQSKCATKEQNTRHSYKQSHNTSYLWCGGSHGQRLNRLDGGVGMRLGSSGLRGRCARALERRLL